MSSKSPTIDRIEVRWRPVSSTDAWEGTNIDPKLGNVRIFNIDTSVQYDIQARSHSTCGRYSDWVTVPHTVLGGTDAPPAITGVAYTRVADNIKFKLTYATTPAADIQTQVHIAPDVSGAPGAYADSGNNFKGAIASIDSTDGVVRWYKFRTVDNRGNVSAFSNEINTNGKTVEDGATLGAKIGPGGNVTGAVDGSGRAVIDFNYASHLNKILDSIGDGPTYGRPLLARLSAGKPWIDFSEGIHANKNASNIPYGSGASIESLKPAAAGADRSPVGLTNIVFQPAPTDTSTPWGWCTASANESIKAYIYGVNTYAPVLGYFELDYVDNGRAYVSRDGANPHKFTCRGGETVYLECDFDAGISSGLQLYVLAFHADGSNSYVYADSSGGGWTHAGPKTFTLPSDCVYFEIMVWGTFSAGDKMFWSNVHVSHDSWGLTKANGIARIGDGRNLIALNSGGYAQAYWSGGTATPGATTMTIPAMTLHVGGAPGISYNSSSASGLTASTTYSFYYTDPSFAGGSQTLHYTAAANKNTVCSNDGNIYIGDIATTASGGSGGGGSIGTCVTPQMMLRPFVPAAIARAGIKIDAADNYALIGERLVQGVRPAAGSALRLTASPGYVLECGADTPFTMPDGSSKTASQLVVGDHVLTDAGDQVLTLIEDIGCQPLIYISAGGISFAAGADATKRIYSHNTLKP